MASTDVIDDFLVYTTKNTEETLKFLVKMTNDLFHDKSIKQSFLTFEQFCERAKKQVDSKETLFGRQLSCIETIGAEKALRISGIFERCSELVKAMQSMGEKEAKEYLADIKYGADLCRSIGSLSAEKIYAFFMND